jgi:hypothetical protein
MKIKQLIARVVNGAALSFVSLCMTCCALPGPPEIAPDEPNSVSADPRDWYIRLSSGVSDHPSAISVGEWSVDVPNFQSGGCVRYIQTPFNVTKTLHSVSVTFVVQGKQAQYHVLDKTDFPPATVHIFFERRDDDFVQANGRWWADFNKYDLGSYDNHIIKMVIPLTSENWSDVHGQHDEKSFQDSLASAGWIGITFGGQDFWANGVAMEAGSSKFVLQDFSVQ